MKSQLIAVLLKVLMSVLTPDLLKEFAGMALDWIRTRVLGTASTLDDMLVLPIIDQIELAFGLDDD